MLKINPLVIMLALLSATPHLTLWAVESTQEPKKVSTSMFEINDGDGLCLGNAKKLANELASFIKDMDLTFESSYSTESGSYKKSIGTMDTTLLLVSKLQKRILSDDFKNEQRIDKSKIHKKESNKIQHFLNLLNDCILNVNTNGLSNADKEMGKKISKLFEKFKEITGNPGKNKNVLPMPNNLNQIREYLIANNPDKYQEEADFVLCTNGITKYIIQFKSKMNAAMAAVIKEAEESK